MNLSKTKYVIVGDININVLKYNLVSNVTNYVNALNSVGCNVCIDKPTRITSNNSTCIDHIYSNMNHDLLETNILFSDISDHLSTLTKIKGISKTKEKTEEIFIRKSDLSDEEWEQFNFELFSILDEKLPNNSDNL